MKEVPSSSLLMIFKSYWSNKFSLSDLYFTKKVGRDTAFIHSYFLLCA